MKLLLGFILLLSLNLWADSFEKGMKAYKNKNYIKALEWYQLSASEGNSEAQNKIGNLYYHGNGVKKDYKEAFRWYKLSAYQGNLNGQYNLASSYYWGEGVNQDYKKAFKWFLPSAKKGDKEAQFVMGYSYHYEEGVRTDYKKAYKWYKLSDTFPSLRAIRILCNENPSFCY